MSNEFELYDRVRLVTDQFAVAGALEGSIGYVIEKYDDGALEVEVSDPLTGGTVAQFPSGSTRPHCTTIRVVTSKYRAGRPSPGKLVKLTWRIAHTSV
jgi:hypothetical protein